MLRPDHISPTPDCNLNACQASSQHNSIDLAPKESFHPEWPSNAIGSGDSAQLLGVVSVRYMPNSAKLMLKHHELATSFSTVAEILAVCQFSPMIYGPVSVRCLNATTCLLWWGQIARSIWTSPVYRERKVLNPSREQEIGDLLPHLVNRIKCQLTIFVLRVLVGQVSSLDIDISS